MANTLAAAIGLKTDFKQAPGVCPLVQGENARSPAGGQDDLCLRTWVVVPECSLLQLPLLVE